MNLISNRVVGEGIDNSKLTESASIMKLLLKDIIFNVR